MVEDEDAFSTGLLLQQLLDLLVIFLLDSFIVGEVLLLALMFHKLEAVLVQSVFRLAASSIVNDSGLWVSSNIVGGLSLGGTIDVLERCLRTNRCVVV